MNRIMTLVAVLSVTACQTYAPLKGEDISGQKVEFIASENGDFHTKTFADYTSDWWTASAGTSRDQIGKPRLPKELNQKDVIAYHPNSLIEQQIKSQLINKLNLKSANNNPDFNVTFGGGWGMKSHPLAVTMYNIYYKGFITISSLQVVPGRQNDKTFYCDYKTDSKYTYEEVFADNGAAIKDASKNIVEVCVQEFSKDIVKFASGSTIGK